MSSSLREMLDARLEKGEYRKTNFTKCCTVCARQLALVRFATGSRCRMGSAWPLIDDATVIRNEISDRGP